MDIRRAVGLKEKALYAYKSGIFKDVFLFCHIKKFWFINI